MGKTSERSISRRDCSVSAVRIVSGVDDPNAVEFAAASEDLEEAAELVRVGHDARRGDHTGEKARVVGQVDHGVERGRRGHA